MYCTALYCTVLYCTALYHTAAHFTALRKVVTINYNSMPLYDIAILYTVVHCPLLLGLKLDPSGDMKYF